jgi:hypothetical protein
MLLRIVTDEGTLPSCTPAAPRKRSPEGG